MTTATTAPMTNLQARLEMASPAEFGRILLAEAKRIARETNTPLVEVLAEIGMLGEEEPTH